MDVQLLPTSAGNVALSRTGRGPTVLLLHGLPGSRHSWDAVVPHLAGHCDVVVPDLLGFGESAKPRALDALHAAAQAGVLLEVLDGLGVPTATVIGHDFGGPVALSLLGRAPQRVRGLGLLATNTFVDTPVPVPLNLVTWPVLGNAAARVLFSPPSLRMMLRSGIGSPRVQLPVATYLGSRAQQRSIATLFAGSLRDLRRLYAPVQEVLSHAAVPGFVMWGDRDPFFSVTQGQRTADTWGAPFQLLENAGHFLPAERPAEVAGAIAELALRVADRSTRS